MDGFRVDPGALLQTASWYQGAREELLDCRRELLDAMSELESSGYLYENEAFSALARRLRGLAAELDALKAQAEGVALAYERAEEGCKALVARLPLGNLFAGQGPPRPAAGAAFSPAAPALVETGYRLRQGPPFFSGECQHEPWLMALALEDTAQRGF